MPIASMKDGPRITGIAALIGERARFFADLGIDLEARRNSRRPECRLCLDWSERRHHLAGVAGAALLERIYALGWAKREPGTRVVRFSAAGERAFRERLGP